MVRVSLSSALVTTDKIADYIPIVSTVTNLVDLVEKTIFKGIGESKKIDGNRYFSHIKDKEIFRCIILLLPVLGNIFIAIIDAIAVKRHNDMQIESAEEEEDVEEKADLIQKAVAQLELLYTQKFHLLTKLKQVKNDPNVPIEQFGVKIQIANEDKIGFLWGLMKLVKLGEIQSDKGYEECLQNSEEYPQEIMDSIRKNIELDREIETFYHNYCEILPNDFRLKEARKNYLLSLPIEEQQKAKASIDRMTFRELKPLMQARVEQSKIQGTHFHTLDLEKIVQFLDRNPQLLRA